MNYADVIVPLAVDGMFTYAVPDVWKGRLGRGSLVIVAFAGNKQYTGVVCRLHDCVPEHYQVKNIEGVVEENIRFSEKHLNFLLWLSEYYMATPGEVIKAALPIAFRLESYTMVARTDREIDYKGLSNHEKMLLQFLRPGEYVSLKELEKLLNVKQVVLRIRELMKNGYVQVKENVEEVFREKTERIVTWAEHFSDEKLNLILDTLKRAPAQYQMLCKWIDAGKSELSKNEFIMVAGNSSAALKGLCEKGVLRIEERKVSRLEETSGEVRECQALSDKQQTVLKEIQNRFIEKDCVLLRGVTSSGKTEIYIHLIGEYLRKGMQVLYMLPEIALTIQIVRRLQQVFGEKVGIYHSGMSDQMRAEMWRKQCSDEPYQLILGVRSSVFLPFRSLGLIVVDEEHDSSYKQKEPAPRYQGRDAAIMLARLYGAKVLLGSATPSFESFYNARQGKYGYVQLDSRYGDVLMPRIVLADISEYRRKKLMKGSFSPLLIDEMKQVLAAGNQVILFQNRRGYSTYMQCDKCGAIPKCKHCDVSLTYYKQRGVLVCRYCGAIVRMSEVCDSCGIGHYRERTPGTERIEEEVARLFPESRVARMDLDVMNSKFRFRKVVEDFEQRKTDILIGTQMVTKGLDFEHVKLVGVIDADSMIHFPDFRAEERAYCMLMQVSGRSGRKGEQGKVIIQTAEVHNRLFGLLKRGDYADLFDLLSEERKLFFYPPYDRMIQVELRHKDLIVLRHASNELAIRLRDRLGRRVCGPAVPEVSKISGMNRIVFILKIGRSSSCTEVKVLLKKEFACIREKKEYAALRIFCDVDPQ